MTSSEIKVGAKIDNFGERSAGLTAVRDARAAEEAGFDSLWMSDHILMPTETSCRYPFSDSGEMVWNPAGPWYDALIWAATLAASTERVEIGTATLIPGLRNPLDLAKQIATIDALSGGRFVLGAGAGWLTEEFEALGYSPEGRGARLDEWIEICREAWAGYVEPREGRFFRLDRPVHMVPTPARDVPVLFGGMSDLALKRVARHHAGWLPLLKPSEDPLEVLPAGIERIRQHAAGAGSPYETSPRVMYNAADPADVGRLLDALAEVGVTDVMVDVDFDDPDGPRRAIDQVRG
ncbi:hypothetical protein GCM10027062_24220 [Nocardioides hungaricus]